VSLRRFVSLVIMVSLVSVTNVSGQQLGQLSGVVIDAENGLPMSGVQVYLEGSSFGNLTNSEGRYIIRGIRPPSISACARPRCRWKKLWSLV
jgi:hypothetical protein